MTSSDAPKWDSVVVGGGHNGLVCAAFLAKAGRKVLLLEAGSEVGGGGRTHEFAPGFRVSMAHLLNRLHPDVAKGLDLEGHGLSLSPVRQVPSIALSARGDPLMLMGAYGEVLEGARPADVRAWAEVRAQLLRYSGILKPLLARRPPALGGMAFSETTAFAMTGLALKRQAQEIPPQLACATACSLEELSSLTRRLHELRQQLSGAELSSHPPTTTHR